MTLSNDINFVDGEFEESGSAYPQVFGITFTPKISGILIGLLGLGGAIYLLLNMIMPAWEAFAEKQAKQTELQGQIAQKKASIQQIDVVKAELAEAKQQQKQVLAVFANEKTLDTLLLDLNRLVVAGNEQLPSNAVKAQLKKYTPNSSGTEPITDGSLGTQVDGKLKRRSVNIEIVGTYNQTQSILRNIERLQPLLIVKNYSSILASEPRVEEGEPSRIGPAPITTSFELEALMPLNPEDVAAKDPNQKK